MKPAEPEYITIGKILSPWGIEGKLKVQVETDFPERFAPSSEVYIARQPVTISNVEWRKSQVIIKLSTIDNTRDAEKLRGQLVEIHNSQLQALPDGQYYHFQLIGLEVQTTQGELLGQITDIITMSSNDTYVVKGKSSEILIPAIEDIVKSIDLDKGCLIIEPIKGLLSLNEKAAK